MKEVILHIGTHKTGTTSIQKAIKGYRKNKVCTTSLPYENHSIPLYTIFSENRYDYHIWKKVGLVKEKIDEFKNKFLQILDKDLDDKEFEKILISGEDISLLSENNTNEMIKYFLKKNLKVKVIIYVRSPIKFILSSLQEMIKNGSITEDISRLLKNEKGVKKISPGYIFRIKKFLSNPNIDEIRVFNYDEITKSDLDIVDHFAKITGINLQKSKIQTNLQLNCFQIALINKLNNVPLNINSSYTRFRLRNIILDQIIKSTNELGTFNKIDENQILYIIDEHKMKKECDWLRNEFKIDFKNSFETNFSNLDQYFNEIIANNINHCSKIFNDFNSKFYKDKSLEENFLEVYFNKIDQNNIIKNFNPKKYLELNPDLKKVNINPYEHFFKLGYYKGRKY